MEIRFQKFVAGLAFAGMAFWPFERTVLAAAPPASSAPPAPAVPGNASEAPSVLYGTVRSLKDKTPLANVPVILTDVKTGGIIESTTTSQGSYIFSGLSAGDYKILVGGGSFSVQRKEGFLKGGTVGEMDFAVNPLTRGTSEIVGSVYEGQGEHKRPLSAKIAVKNVRTKEVYQVTSDNTGIFSLKNIPQGNYIV